MYIAYNSFCSLGADEFISLSKPQQVFDACFDPTVDKLVMVEPVEIQDIALAHDYDWANEVLDGYADNGFGNRSAKALTQILNANGAMVAAAEKALETGYCFAPVSGFHHAGYDFNGGYCTFNGMIIALQKLKRAGKISTALILDFDGHYGDGTAHIIHETDLLWINHLTRESPLRTADQSIKAAIKALQEKPDIVIYQAGADSHIDDPYGVGYFDDIDWEQRDSWVFTTCRDLGIPVAWNLAGGYNGIKTIQLHRKTFNTACRIFEPNRLHASQHHEAAQY